MIRSLVLFTHVVGVLALFLGLGLEWIGLDGIQRSTTRAEAFPWLRLIKFAYSTGTTTRRGSDFNTFNATWQLVMF